MSRVDADRIDTVDWAPLPALEGIFEQSFDATAQDQSAERATAAVSDQLSVPLESLPTAGLYVGTGVVFSPVEGAGNDQAIRPLADNAEPVEANCLWRVAERFDMNHFEDRIV